MGTSSSLGQVKKGGQVQPRDKYINGYKYSLGTTTEMGTTTA